MSVAAKEAAAQAVQRALVACEAPSAVRTYEVVAGAVGRVARLPDRSLSEMHAIAMKEVSAVLAHRREVRRTQEDALQRVGFQINCLCSYVACMFDFIYPPFQELDNKSRNFWIPPLV